MRRALVNPISLVSTIALSGGKSRKLLGISKYPRNRTTEYSGESPNSIICTKPKTKVTRVSGIGFYDGGCVEYPRTIGVQ